MIFKNVIKFTNKQSCYF